MLMKLKIKVITEGCEPIRANGELSDAIDLRLAEDVSLKKGEIYVAKLGIAVQLPKGMIARIYSRSSNPSKRHVGIANGVGYIDNTYRGEQDVWRAPLYAFEDVELKKGTRICQFEVVPSQFSTPWQKLKWLFNSKINLIFVPTFNTTFNRGGIGNGTKNIN